jgi:PIN domain
MSPDGLHDGGVELIVRTGVSVADTIAALRSLASSARNALAAGSDIVTVQYEYLRWVEDAERQLRSRFASDDVWHALHTDRYWHIRELQTWSPRPYPVIELEASLQADRLEALADRLEQGQQRLQMAPGCVPVVADTNVFVHYRRYDELDWPRLVTARSVRLVVPLLVLDELDDLSYRSRDVGERAHDVLRSLRNLRSGAPPEVPVDVRQAVTMQILMDPPGHRRVPNHDQEILRRVETLTTLSGVSAVLVSGDYGMQLRAEARGIRCEALPDEPRLPAAQPGRLAKGQVENA